MKDPFCMNKGNRMKNAGLSSLEIA